MRKIFLTEVFTCLLVLFASLASLSPLAAAETGPDEVFAAANRDFEAARFDEAIAAYRDLVDAGLLSPELFFNLGTAAYRLGKTGEAILWMRRALVLEPAMPEVRQNLEFLRGKIAYLEFIESDLTRFISRLPVTFTQWAVALSLWTALLSLSLAFAVERLRPNRSALVTLTVVAVMMALVSSRIGHYRTTRIAVENFATITVEGARVLTAPAPEAKPVIDLPPGSEVRILRESGPWFYAEIPGDLRGWIPSTALEPVWPIPSPAKQPPAKKQNS